MDGGESPGGTQVNQEEPPDWWDLIGVLLRCLAADTAKTPRQEVVRSELAAVRVNMKFQSNVWIYFLS